MLHAIVLMPKVGMRSMRATCWKSTTERSRGAMCSLIVGSLTIQCGRTSGAYREYYGACNVTSNFGNACTIMWG